MKALRRHLESSGITQQDFAKAVGAAQSSLSAWLSGQTEPSFAKLKRCARLTGLTLNQLLDFHDSRAKTPAKFANGSDA